MPDQPPNIGQPSLNSSENTRFHLLFLIHISASNLAKPTLPDPGVFTCLNGCAVRYKRECK